MHLILSASVNISVINTIFKQILIFSPKNGRFLRKNTYSAISQIVKGYKLEILFVENRQKRYHFKHVNLGILAKNVSTQPLEK